MWVSCSCDSVFLRVLQLTGRHVVRDVSCKCCDVRLGWIYVITLVPIHSI